MACAPRSLACCRSVLTDRPPPPPIKRGTWNPYGIQMEIPTEEISKWKLNEYHMEVYTLNFPSYFHVDYLRNY